MYMYQGLEQMLTIRLQHHQGCSETQKCAYVIYGQPLIIFNIYDTWLLCSTVKVAKIQFRILTLLISLICKLVAHFLNLHLND